MYGEFVCADEVWASEISAPAPSAAALVSVLAMKRLRFIIGFGFYQLFTFPAIGI
jgi:hypothetical protein